MSKSSDDWRLNVANGYRLEETADHGITECARLSAREHVERGKECCMNRTAMSEIPELGASDSPDEIYGAVQRYGIAKLPGRCTADNLAKIRSECSGIIESPPEQSVVLNYGSGTGYRLLREQLAASHTATAEFFGQEWMREVVDQHFDGDHAFNNDVIIVYDKVDTEHFARAPHYDKTPNLKFFLYLSDVTEDTGPFTCFPGTQTFGKQAQVENRERLRIPEPSETRILPPELVENPVPVLGPAGTLLVVDGDIIHRGAPIRRGHRLAVRSRSYLWAYAPRHTVPDSAGSRVE